MECKIRVELTRGYLVVKEVNECPFAAVANATNRIGHVVSRHLDRVKQSRRRRPKRYARDGQLNLAQRGEETAL